MDSIENSEFMDKTSSPDSPSTQLEQNVSVLDILVTLAENARLLVAGPLLVGIIALGIGYLQPQSFESVAVLQADSAAASLMTTAAVLDPVGAKLGLVKVESVDEARRMLREQIKVTVGRNDKLLTLTVSASTPKQAQAIGNAVLEQSYLRSSPKGTSRARLETQLAEAQGRLKNAQNAAIGMLKGMESSSGNGADQVRGYAELLAASAAAQAQISELEAKLEGLSESQLVQPPTLPEKASHPKKAMQAIGATLATGLILLLYVFIRQGLRNMASDAEAAGKLARIQRALGLKKSGYLGG
ncbi:hypothetical protein [Polaromonas sp.]|uniref:hypothetical protein n=1 Tax=Polaromonas sp. TaxID=1869339 RepID=UPI00375004E8